MKKRRYPIDGFSLVELVVGIAIMIFVLAVGIRVFTSLSRHTVASDKEKRINTKLLSVADRVRYEASYRFDSMTTTEPECSYTKSVSLDPGITVCADIGPINTETRSRDVVLTGTYSLDGQTKTKTLEFSVTNIRAKTAGSTIFVQVLDKIHTNIPVERVQISYPGNEIPEIIEYTDAEGKATLRAAKVDKAGIWLTINAVGAKAGGVDASYYFGELVPPLFVKMVKTDPISPNSENHQFTDGGTPGPIYLDPPATLEGTVRNINGDLPVGQNEVRIRLVSKSLLLPTAGNSNIDLNEWTESGGHYRFNNLSPGDYWIYVDTGTKWAALGEQNDIYNLSNTTAEKIEVKKLPLVTPQKDFQVVRKGSVRGTIKGVKLNAAGNFSLGNLARAGFKLRTPLDNSRSFNAGGTMLPLNNTMAWATMTNYTLVNEPDYATAQTNSNGFYEFENFTPAIVEKNTPLTAQYNVVNVRGWQVPNDGSNLTPIIVRGPSGKDPSMWPQEEVQFFLYNHDVSWSPPKDICKVSMNIDPASSLNNCADPSVSSFNLNVNTDQPTDYNLYALTKDSLANVSGKIIIQGNYNQNIAVGGDVGVEMTYKGYGAIQLVDGMLSLKHTLVVKVASDSTYTFDMSSAGGLSHPLIPNLGIGTTRVRFSKFGYPSWDRNFVGTVSATKRVQGSDGNATDENILPSHLNNVTLNARLLDYKGIAVIMDDVGGLDLGGGVGGPGSFKKSLTVQTSAGFLGFLPVVIKPGDNLGKDITVNVNSSTPWSYYLQITGDSTGEAYIRDMIHNDPGVLFACGGFCDQPGSPYVSATGDPVRLWRVQTMNQLYGKVVAQNQTTPLFGAVIHVTLNADYASPSDFTVIDDPQLDACVTLGKSCGPNGPYDYYFENLKFAGPTPISIRASAPGYTSQTVTISPYEGWSAPNGINFNLVPGGDTGDQDPPGN